MQSLYRLICIVLIPLFVAVLLPAAPARADTWAVYWYVCGSDLERRFGGATADIVEALKAELNDDVKVVLQTIPPFDYEGEMIGKWQRVNDYIRQTLSQKAALVFDVVPWLRQDEEHPHMAKFVGHPNAEGCAVWADALYDALMDCGLLK